MQNCQAICGEPGSLKAVLRIQYKTTGSSEAPVGCVSRREDINILSFNIAPRIFKAVSDNDQNYLTLVAVMVHELGKN